MEPDAAKALGAGIACIGMGTAGIGLGHIFGNFLAGAIRNPPPPTASSAASFSASPSPRRWASSRC